MNVSDTRITIRVPASHAALIRSLTDRSINPLAPTQTQILLRGLELVAEQQKPKPKAKPKPKRKGAHKRPHPWRLNESRTRQ